MQSSAGAGVLTVFDAQDDVSEVEPSLLLAEGLLTGHLHHRPVGKRDSSSELCTRALTPLLGECVLHHHVPAQRARLPKGFGCWAQDGGVSILSGHGDVLVIELG